MAPHPQAPKEGWRKQGIQTSGRKRDPRSGGSRVKSGRSEKEIREEPGCRGAQPSRKRTRRQEGRALPHVTAPLPPPHRRDKALCGVFSAEAEGIFSLHHVSPLASTPGMHALPDLPLLSPLRLPPVRGRTSRRPPFASHPPPQIPQNKSHPGVNCPSHHRTLTFGSFHPLPPISG